MGITRACYISVRDLQQATDAATTTHNLRQSERAIEAASETVEALTNRSSPGSTFVPTVVTRKFDWPDTVENPTSWRLWLDEHELVSITTLTSGSTTLVEGTDFVLRPQSGPPYDSIQILLDGDNGFTTGDTWQDAITAVGVAGYDDQTVQAATTSEALDATETGVDVGACPDLSAGDLITIDTERMLITGTSLLDTGQDTTSDLAASMAVDTVPVGSGTGFASGEVLTIDSERVLVVDVAGNNLIVQRAYDGSTLAAHTSGASVYAPRTLTVTRGYAGTTATTHLTASTVYKQVYPPMVRALALAEALNTVAQESAGYARTIGSGEGTRNATGAGLDAARATAVDALYRHAGPWTV